MSRVAIVVAAGAVALGTLSGCGHAQDGAAVAPGSKPAGAAAAPAAPTVHTINVKVRGGKASGDTGRVAVPLGTPVIVSVTSDVGDEIHVHGYDRKAKVPPGATGSVAFTASNAGVFEVELEGSKLQLLQLQVG